MANTVEEGSREAPLTFLLPMDTCQCVEQRLLIAKVPKRNTCRTLMQSLVLAGAANTLLPANEERLVSPPQCSTRFPAQPEGQKETLIPLYLS